MSWAEVKKINSDLSTPLDELIKTGVNSDIAVPLDKLIKFTPSTPAARTALANLGYTQRSTITSPAGTIYLYWKNTSVKSCSWDEAYEICTNWWKEINRWSQAQGYGNICIASRMPAYTDTGSWLPSGNTWTGTQYISNYYGNHYYWESSNYGGNGDLGSRQVVPVVLII